MRNIFALPAALSALVLLVAIVADARIRIGPSDGTGGLVNNGVITTTVTTTTTTTTTVPPQVVLTTNADYTIDNAAFSPTGVYTMVASEWPSGSGTNIYSRGTPGAEGNWVLYFDGFDGDNTWHLSGDVYTTFAPFGQFDDRHAVKADAGLTTITGAYSGLGLTSGGITVDDYP